MNDYDNSVIEVHNGETGGGPLWYRIGRMKALLISRHVTKVTAEEDDTWCHLLSSLRLPRAQFGRTEIN